MVVAIIGAGVVGSAVVKCLKKSGLKELIIATRRQVHLIKDLEKKGVVITDDNKQAAKKATIVILCVKPKDICNVLREIRNEIKGKIIISMAAAVNIETLKALAPEAKFIRAMPNIAILIQESFTAYSIDSRLTSSEKTKALRLLNSLGKAIEIEEKQMDSITAISGCAPGYLSVIMEAMVQAGIEAGLSKDIALTASAQSMIGTGKLVIEAKKEPGELKKMVATPGGITEEEFKELEKASVRDGFLRALKVGIEKSRQISDSLMST